MLPPLPPPDETSAALLALTAAMSVESLVGLLEETCEPLPLILPPTRIKLPSGLFPPSIWIPPALPPLF